MSVIGIDPGLKGAMVALGDNGALLWFCCADYDCGPFQRYAQGKRFAPSAVRDFLSHGRPDIVCIEQQSGRPAQGRGSLMSIAWQQGFFEGACMGLELPFVLARPQAWRKSVNAQSNGENPKGVSLRVAEQLYPDVNFVLPGRRKPHDGFVDALLIARHAWKENR